MLILCCLSWYLAGAGLFLGASPQTQSDKGHPKTRVQIASVSKVFIAKDKPAYLVSYHYDFAGMSEVYVKGLGVIPPQGQYQYISVDRQLEFRDPSTDALLESVPLTETTVIAAKPPLNEIPSDDQFSAAYRAYIWDTSAPVQQRANTVLASYFNYLPHQREAVNYLATTYTPLPLARKLASAGISAQVALLLSFPHEPARGTFSVHIQYSVREGRALSDDLRPTSNAEIIKSANDFVDTLVITMKAKH